MPEPPGEPEPGATRAVPLAADEISGDRGEMVRVGRVTQPEQDRDRDDDPITCRLRRRRFFRRDRTSRHLRKSGGGADSHASPTTRITEALTRAARGRSGRRSGRAHEALRATGDEPDGRDGGRQPKLKATISTRPKPTRCSEIAARRTTSADGQGKRPPEIPTARRSRACLFVVVVMVVVPAAARGDASGARTHPDADHEQRRDEVQPRVEASGTMNSESASVTSPSANTPAVCVTVTIRPRSSACRGVPREPTR